MKKSKMTKAIKAEDLYHEEIYKWLQYLENCPGEFRQLSDQYFRNKFIPNICKAFCFSMVMDNLAADDLVKKLQTSTYHRFSRNHSLEAKDNFTERGEKSTIIDLETSEYPVENHEEENEEKYQYIFYIAETLYENKFITKSKMQIITFLCSPQNSLEEKLETYLNRRKHSHSSKIISISEWNEIMVIDCRLFWEEWVFTKPNLVRNNEIFQKVWDLFREFLRKKINYEIFQKLTKLFGVEENYLNKMANIICLFSSPKKIQMIEMQLSSFQEFLKAELEANERNPNQIIKFETYGSYRSRMCSSHSDVDLTVFISTEYGTFTQEREFIEKKLWKIYSILNKDCKMGSQYLRIESVAPLINSKIKVPVVRVKFSNERPFNNMDIVVNNYHGVQNSKMLGVFSNNLQIRNLAILVKRWGKIQHIIGISELSSYGITFMLLFFLMKRNYIDYLTHETIKNLDPDVTFKKEFNVIPALFEFFSFYCQEGYFFQKNRFVCLLKNCYNHEDLYMKEFIVNMHDPFNDTNPGRMKTTKDYIFFSAFERAREKMSEIMTMDEEQQEVSLEQFFQFNYEEIKL